MGWLLVFILLLPPYNHVSWMDHPPEAWKGNKYNPNQAMSSFWSQQSIGCSGLCETVDIDCCMDFADATHLPWAQWNWVVGTFQRELQSLTLLLAVTLENGFSLPGVAFIFPFTSQT